MSRLKNIVICGATGFIGRNLTSYYSNQLKYKVFATYNKTEPFGCNGVTWVKADLREKSDVERAVVGMDIVIQAAATTSGVKDIVNTPHIHVTDNSVMNSLIFRACYDFNVKKVVFFSCTVMYQSSDTPLKESDFDANEQIYHDYFGVGWTKVYIEKQAEFFAKIGRTQYTVFRHTNVYGPYDKYDLEKSHVFGATMAKIMKNNTGVIEVWGSGETGRDLIYIDDMVDAVDKAIHNQNESFGLYNIGIGKAVMIKKLVQKIIDASNKDIEIKFDTTKPDIKTKLCVDYLKAQQKIGWKPSTTLEEGIEKTMKWYEENKL